MTRLHSLTRAPVFGPGATDEREATLTRSRNDGEPQRIQRPSYTPHQRSGAGSAVVPVVRSLPIEALADLRADIARGDWSIDDDAA